MFEKKIFPSLQERHDGGLPLAIVLNICRRINWSFRIRVKAANEEVHEPFMEGDTIWNAGL